MEKKLKETIDKLLLFFWKDIEKYKFTNVSEEEHLVTLIHDVSWLAREMTGKEICYVILPLVRMMAVYGFEHVDLNEKYSGNLTGNSWTDVYHLQRILASNHSVRTKMVVTLGTLIAFAEHYNVADACSKSILEFIDWAKGTEK